LLRTKIFLGLISLIILALLAGCISQSEPKPEDVVLSFLEASLHGEHEAAYEYLSKDDKAFKSKEAYVEEFEESPMTKLLEKKISFDIVNSETSESDATVQVEITMPDLGSMLLDLMGVALSSSLSSEEDQKKLEQAIEEKYGQGNVPMTSEKQTFHLLKEENAWKIFMNWRGEAQAAKDASEAKKRKAEEDRQNAFAELQKKMELENARRAQKEQEKLRREAKIREEKDKYIEKLALTNIEVSKRRDPSYAGPIKIISGTLKNNGERTLDKVEVTVYFLDAKGIVIGEEDYHPVLNSSFSYGDSNKPLKPNYVRDFAYKLGPYAPSTWAGEIKAKITDIEFSK